MVAIKKASNQNVIQKISIIRILVVLFILVLLLIPFVIWQVGHNEKISGLISYQGDKFTFLYPKDWTVSKSEIATNTETIIFMQPPNATPPKTPNVTVEIAPATQTTISDMTDPFTIFKYTVSNTVVEGINAQKYSKVVPSSEGVLHSTAYVFEAKGYFYVVKLGYKQLSPDQQLENEFNQIVNSFSFR